MRFLALSWDGTGFTLFLSSSSTIWVVLWGEIFLQPPPPFPHFFPYHILYLFSGNSIFVLLQTRIEQSDDEMSSLSPRQQQTALLTSLTQPGTGRRQWGSTCCAFFVSKEGTISGGWCHQEFLKAGVVLCAWYRSRTRKPNTLLKQCFCAHFFPSQIAPEFGFLVMKHKKRRMLGSMEENSCRFGIPNSS